MTFNADAVVLSVVPERRSWLATFRSKRSVDLSALAKDEMAVAMAIARLRHLDPLQKSFQINNAGINLSHELVAKLDTRTAVALGMPALINGFVFRARLVGTVGSPNFRIEWWWEKNGRTVSLPMTGAIVGSKSVPMRLPEPIYLAIAEASQLEETTSLSDHWLALGRFRKLFDMTPDSGTSTVLDGFLREVSVVTCDAVGLAFDLEDPTQFYPLPFIATNVPEEGNIGLDNAALQGQELEEFKTATAKRASQPAYRIAKGKFLILDPSVFPIVDTIVDNSRKDENGRTAFVADAGRIISQAVEEQMLRDGKLTELMSSEARAERVEAETGRAWVETSEWISRVTGIAKWQASDIDGMESSGTNWLPDSIDAELGKLLAMLPEEELADIIQRLKEASAEALLNIDHHMGRIPVSATVIEALSRRLADLLRQKDTDKLSAGFESYLPVTHDNFWEVDFKAAVRPRIDELESEVPLGVNTQLQPHQLVAFNWQTEAWQQGLPGVLNADEQGLGKTLQTLAFITWLKEQMVHNKVASGPILIVAPTSLLLNWEAEIERHIHQGHLGIPIRLYGDHLLNFKKDDSSGQDIRTGEGQLDPDAILRRENGAPLVITTYQTLANYAISLLKIPFAVAIFDEIQFLKNPVTMRARAAKSVRADFRIGLTGTPIENATKDLWALMDQLFPGALGARATFRRIFDSPTEENMAVLHSALFRSQGGRPQLAMRRLKTDAAPHLPTKVRILHPREMPEPQMLRYDEARVKGGIMLALLHHIRRISLHPGLIEAETPDEFTAASARVSAALDILRHIKTKNERALVFIENRDVQAWFAELVRLEFDLERVMIINGDTTIDARMDITDRFQRHLKEDNGFDVLVLGPRSAGTGLTLTAANHVIHLSRWWNPAVEEQCNDRTHRIGQTKPVTIHIPLAVHPKLGRGSFDCLLQNLMKRKRALAERILWPGEATENETKLLYDAVISASVNAEPKGAAEFQEALQGRDDLSVQFISAGTVRVGRLGGGATIVVSSDSEFSINLQSSHSDAALITTHPHVREKLSPPLPHSRLSSGTLWPDFILPD